MAFSNTFTWSKASPNFNKFFSSIFNKNRKKFPERVNRNQSVINNGYFDDIRSILSIKKKGKRERKVQSARKCIKAICIYIESIFTSRFERNFAEMRMTMVRGEERFLLGKKIRKITGCKTQRSIRVLGRYVYNTYTRGKAAWKWECVSSIPERAGNRLFSTLRYAS